MASREAVYHAIDTECSYQDSLVRHDKKYQEQMERLSIIRRICRDWENRFYEVAGEPPLDFARKIAAVAVRCMEQHGAPVREGL